MCRSIQIPAGWRVFVLDDTEERLDWFRSRLPRIRSAKTAEEALAILSAEEFDAVFLDHDLHWMDAGYPDRQHGNGKEVARYLAYSKFAGKVVIHSRSEQADVMAKILPQATVCRYGDFEITQDAPLSPQLRQCAGS
jgi:CheY-like chemotaxis protein